MPGKELRYQLNTRLGGAQNRNGRSGGEKSFALTGNRVPDRSVRSLVAIPTALLAALDEIDVCVWIGFQWLGTRSGSGLL